eukprot:CAMPEP_0118949092 /NCGR_PEP_ID=MMETSP1169-20130426/49008_1 /TAXON_ID=36882 /ORGANISM="Pyramimonas obovata, Strain CCMP722" /LENGTH=301 /DNA_ID=CAMNT_0006895649 /DNA_START=427 /DNA_END=1327 /DNA_ORIENTATION=+
MSHFWRKIVDDELDGKRASAELELAREMRKQRMAANEKQRSSRDLMGIIYKNQLPQQRREGWRNRKVSGVELDNPMRLSLGLHPVVNYGIYKDENLLPLLTGHRHKPQTAEPKSSRNPGNHEHSLTMKSVPELRTRHRPNTVGVSRAKQIVAQMVAQTSLTRSAPLSTLIKAEAAAVENSAPTTSLPEVRRPSISFHSGGEFASRRSESQDKKIRKFHTAPVERFNIHSPAVFAEGDVQEIAESEVLGVCGGGAQLALEAGLAEPTQPAHFAGLAAAVFATQPPLAAGLAPSVERLGPLHP